MERTDTSNLETDGLRLDGVEDEEIVDRSVLLAPARDGILVALRLGHLLRVELNRLREGPALARPRDELDRP